MKRTPTSAAPPPSVTKVMTMLLIAEAVDGGEITLSDEGHRLRRGGLHGRQPGVAGGGASG